MVSTTGKLCNKCNKWKPLEEFYKQHNTPDGRKYCCAECSRAYQRQRWIDEPEKLTAINKKWIDANRDRHRETTRERVYRWRNGL